MKMTVNRSYFVKIGTMPGDIVFVVSKNNDFPAPMPWIIPGDHIEWREKEEPETQQLHTGVVDEVQDNGRLIITRL